MTIDIKALKQELEETKQDDNSIVLNLSGYSDYEYAAADTITLSSGGADTITLGAFDYDYSPHNNTIIGGASITVPWVSGTNTSIGISDWATTQVSPKLKLDGEDADIEVNGVSLMQSIEEIRERLNLLTPKPELEKEWDQLRELGERYRKLEAELEEKSKMWSKLKDMPPPDLS